jgi:hypothetical protein
MKIAKMFHAAVFRRKNPVIYPRGGSLSRRLNLILYVSVALSVVALVLLNAGDDGAAAVVVGLSVLLCAAGFVLLRRAAASPLHSLRAYIDQINGGD